MTFTLEPLPWKEDDLAPIISRETVQYHYDKHHRGYVTKLNGLVEGKPEAEKNLPALIMETDGSIYNNAAQIWNHSFYWQSMQPYTTNSKPSADLEAALKDSFGGVDKFKDEFTKAGLAHFGSGWVWLVKGDDKKLRIVTTHDAGHPTREMLGIPLLTCDLWEHAYYIDYRNERANYLKGWWNVVNWEFVASNLATRRFP